MSVFRCCVCDTDFDSDFHAMEQIDDMPCCEDCYLEQEQEAKNE